MLNAPRAQAREGARASARALRLGWIRQRAWLAPVLAAGALERLDETWFRVRHPAGPPAAGPPAAGPPPACGDTREAICASVGAGLAFLERAQRADGLWRGFMLPPGASTEWISAHVCYLLEDVPDTRAMRERAAAALLARGRRRAGWGYNHRIRPDSDSTAQAMLAIERVGGEISPDWVRTLLATRDEDGGFATYPSTRPDGLPRTWWEMPHADVTLIVIEALRRVDRCAQERSEAFAWLHGCAHDGVLAAYWWTSPAYSLWAQAHCGFEPHASSSAAEERLAREPRPVYLAMLISAAAAHGGWSAPLESAVSRLVNERREDGSWLCAPCLRNTRADHAGGFDAPGPVYADRYRVFSTAHAVAALWLALRALEAAEPAGQTSG
jgi:hypothetical protein